MIPVSRLLDRHGPYVLPLIVGRLADTVTTLHGLSLAGIYERNPLVAALIEALGPGAGILVANVISIGVVLLAVEIGVAAVGEDLGRIELRVEEHHVLEVAYLPAVALSFGAAVNNLVVIATI